MSISAFSDEGKGEIKEWKQSTKLQAKSSPPTLDARNPSALPGKLLHRTTITGVLFLIRRVRQSPPLPRKLSTLENNKTTNGQRASSGQTGVTYNHPSASPPAETLLRLLLPLIFWLGRPLSHGWSLPISLGQSEGPAEPFNRQQQSFRSRRRARSGSTTTASSITAPVALPALPSRSLINVVQAAIQTLIRSAEGVFKSRSSREQRRKHAGRTRHTRQEHGCG